ncbi:MAG: LysM peptidoglycan-binding domain-containing protein [Lachnospiraceae bacterium]|jgi:LysM repeat protein|nr:LysM peptidoglycan-binding domain-containing protein [Lachnospiraceae bacterium]
MKIKLKASGDSPFYFSVMPEQIQAKSSAKYQSFDTISKGTIKVPKGTDVEEVSWDGEFFGASKRKESIVQTGHWMEPEDCIFILKRYMKKGTILNLIVSETWINMDVTISSLTASAYGAYGNIKYSITFSKVKPLRIYTTNESKIGKKKKLKSRPSNKMKDKAKGSIYTVKSGDTLWGIAVSKLGSGLGWKKIYSKNKAAIESAAKKHGRKDSDNGHWIYPGTKLAMP